jgi:hypothetical protein
MLVLSADWRISMTDALSVTIPAINLGSFEHKLSELNKKARKLGIPEASFIVVREFQVAVRNEIGIEVYPYSRKMYEILVDGAQPVRLNGWSFVATIEPTDGGNIVHAVPGEEVPVAYRSSDLTCDHCHTNRYRKQVYIVKHQDGRYAQVGSNCLADFVSHRNANTLALQAQWLAGLKEIFDPSYSWPMGERREEIVGFVSIAAAVIRQYGWAKSSEDNSTRNRTWDYATGFPYVVKEMQEQGFEVKDEDVSLAKDALAWARAIPATVTNDYLYNLRTASSADDVNSRNAGLIASIVFAYRKEIERKLAKENELPSEWLGTVGQKLTAQLTVLNVMEFNGDYGIVRIIKMTDAQGNIVVWKTSSWDSWMEQGAQIILSAKVKAHDTYRDVKQTVVTRASVTFR